METTYDVKIYKILTYKGARKTTYTVRWVVAGKRWREPFNTVALAEGFRSELIQATGKGEAFVIATGLPVSHRSKSAAMSWYKFAVEYVDARWPELGGNSRRNTAKTLTATTIALLRARPTELFQGGHRSGDGRVVGDQCRTDKAPGRLSEMSDVSTLPSGSLVGYVSCSTGPAARAR